MRRIVTVLLAAMMLLCGLQIATAEDIAEAVVSEESLKEELAAEIPAEAPAAEEPAAEEPAAPAAEEPAEKTAAEEPVAEEPADGEAKAAETETAKKPAKPAPAPVEIEDYETPLGPKAIRTIVLDNLGKTTISFREHPNGMSDVIAELPENTRLAILSIEDDWAKAVAADRIGYVYVGDIRSWLEPEGTQEAERSDMKVTIFSSRRRGAEAGETILLSSRIEGFEGYEIRYQWECDKHDGMGFRDVDGANESEYGFSASADSLNWDWRLSIYYR